MTERFTDEELERIMREGLARHAEGAPDRLEESTASPSRRRSRWPAVAAAAAVAVIGVPLGVQLLGEPGDDEPHGTDRVAVAPGTPDTWRVESYGGVQVRVPNDWGWGGAPMANLDPDDDRPLDCGAAPFVRPGDDSYETVPADTPYVGRPVMMTDACTIIGLEGAPLPQAPAADSVWLDAFGVEPGTVDVGNGYVRETVAVGDGAVTVTSDDADLRARILGTAEAVDVDANGCATTGDWADVPDGTLHEVEPDSLSVCSYMTFQSETTLVWSAQGDATAAAEYAEAVETSSATYDPLRLCTEQPDGEWLAIGVNGADGETAWTGVVMDQCAQILWHYRAQGDPEAVAASPVVPRTAAPWAGSWARAYVAGPSGWGDYAGKDGAGFFRGYLG